MTSASVGDKRKRDDDDDADDVMDGLFELELHQLEHDYEQLLNSMGEDTKTTLVELYSPDRFGTRGKGFGVTDFLA
eukprot:7615997-Karenia_brevis.AAC.1